MAQGLVAAAGLGVIPLLDVLGHMHVIDMVQEPTRGWGKRALVFLREQVSKLHALFPATWLVDELVGEVAANMHVTGLLKKISGARTADRLCQEQITQAQPPPTHEQADALRADLTKLHADYGKHTAWLALWTRRLRHFSTPLSHIATGSLGGVGYFVMPAVFALGGGYVSYSLTDRLDARALGPADHVEGIVRLVQRHI